MNCFIETLMKTSALPSQQVVQWWNLCYAENAAIPAKSNRTPARTFLLSDEGKSCDRFLKNNAIKDSG